jgi:hypothetical protein
MTIHFGFFSSRRTFSAVNGFTTLSTTLPLLMPLATAALLRQSSNPSLQEVINTGFFTRGNNLRNLLSDNNFDLNLKGNNVSVTFFQKLLATTRGCG